MSREKLTLESSIDDVFLPAKVIEIAKSNGAKTVEDLLKVPANLIIPSLAEAGIETIGTMDRLWSLTVIHGLRNLKAPLVKGKD